MNCTRNLNTADTENTGRNHDTAMKEVISPNHSVHCQQKVKGKLKAHHWTKRNQTVEKSSPLPYLLLID